MTEEQESQRGDDNTERRHLRQDTRLGSKIIKPHLVIYTLTSSLFYFNF